MNFREAIEKDYKEALKSLDKVRVSALRMLKAALKNQEINLGKELTKTDEVKILQSLIKQREESIQAFSQGQRYDLAEKERQEINILSKYLPEPLSYAELEILVRTVADEQGVSLPKEAKKIIKFVLERAKGRVDGKRVQAMVDRIFRI